MWWCPKIEKYEVWSSGSCEFGLVDGAGRFRGSFMCQNQEKSTVIFFLSQSMFLILVVVRALSQFLWCLFPWAVAPYYTSGVSAAWHQHRTRRNFPQMGENSHPASHRHINLFEVTRPEFDLCSVLQNQCHRYFHDSLPYGTGPGTDTDLASVMNGEGNRRFDEVPACTFSSALEYLFTFFSSTSPSPR